MQYNFLHNFNIKCSKKGATLAEILVVAAVVSLLMLVLFMVFRSNLNTMTWGQKHMDFNYKIQYVMKMLYTDVKRVNTDINFGKYGDLYIAGERSGEFFPQMVVIEHKTAKKQISLRLPLNSTLYADSVPKIVTYMYSTTENILYREERSSQGGATKTTVVAQNIYDLVFIKSEDDPQSIKFVGRIGDDKRVDVYEDIDFTVRLETELVNIKVAYL